MEYPHEKFCKPLSSPEELIDILHQQGSISARIWLPIHSDKEYTSHFTGTEHCIYVHSYIAEWIHKRIEQQKRGNHSYWNELWKEYIYNTMRADVCGHRLYIKSGDADIYIPYTWKTEGLTEIGLGSNGLRKSWFTKYQAGEKMLLQGQAVHIRGRFTLQQDGT